ncbi:MAG: AMP-binding protein [Armatimonadetes bacterium]|nr:AMP-binding protein [Armatimonadota bacterium]
MTEFDLPVAWTPSEESIRDANITRQMERYGIKSYEAFLRRSVDDPDWFWRAFFEDAGFVWKTPYRQTLDLIDGKPWAKWFAGGALNWTESALDRHIAAGNGNSTALVWEGEEGATRRYTYAELLGETNRLANGLIELGVQKGDRVGLFLPFCPEVAIALLAISRIGAIALPLFSGFGHEPLEVRMNDAEAKVLFVADGTHRRGKVVDMKSVADRAAANIPSLKHCIVVRRTGRSPEMTEGRDRLYEDVLSENDQFSPPAFPSDQGCMIIYTSGTTGKPKGAYHIHSGFPVKAAQDMFHLFDVKPTDTVSWLSDIGWMMGPWVIMGSLILGATLFMYDGAPDFPTPDRVWQMTDRHGISVLGLTPTLIRALMRSGEEHPQRWAMDRLRLIGSTGEPWNPEPWLWTLKNVGKGRAPIINYSGGTEISGGILGCTQLRPLKPCCFNTTNPGVDVAVLNERGERLKGEVGLLAVRNINPGMTRGFWRDPERYVETYWSQWPDLWYHGDLCLEDADGYWYILGRADDTLKIAGKRVGPAEIESALVEHPMVSEAGVIGVPDELKGQAAVAFAVLKPGAEPTPELERELIELAGQRLGKPMAPKAVKFVSDLPKTRNAKVMRRALRAAYLGEPQGDLTALENPSALEAVAALRDSQENG